MALNEVRLAGGQDVRFQAAQARQVPGGSQAAAGEPVEINTESALRIREDLLQPRPIKPWGPCPWPGGSVHAEARRLIDSVLDAHGRDQLTAFADFVHTVHSPRTRTEVLRAARNLLEERLETEFSAAERKLMKAMSTIINDELERRGHEPPHPCPPGPFPPAPNWPDWPFPGPGGPGGPCPLPRPWSEIS